MNKASGITRRSLLKGASAAAATGVLGTSVQPAMSQSGGGRPRVLALIGDRYHNSDYIRVSLDPLFKELDLPVDYTTNYYDLSARLLQPYQLFVAFRDNMIWPGGYLEPTSAEYARQLENRGDFPPEKPEYWITEEQGQAVKEFVQRGNGFYSMHNNAFVSRSSKNYREVQGGCALSHPPLRPFKVKIANKNHPITEGVADFMVTDEQHYLVYDKDPKDILLHSENVDGLTFTPTLEDPEHPAPPKDLGTTTVSGWAFDYGKGRVVFTAIGHTIHAMWQPQHARLQRNAVRWLLKMT